MFDINKIIKKSKNNSMFNNFNFNTPISNPINNFKGVGASPKMQKMWGNMSTQKRNVLRKILPDNDGDRVPNIYDCQPNNVMRQDFTPLPSYRSDEAAEMSAARRFGGQLNLNRLKRIGGGRDRDVYALDKDKVLKVAKNPGGIVQNRSESNLEYLDMIKHYETGKDYVVMERAQPLGPQAKKKLALVRKEISKLPYERKGYSNNYGVNIQSGLSGEDSVLDKTGIGLEILDYDPNPTEVFANRQWGEKNGQPVLVDGGALLGGDTLSTYTQKQFEEKQRKTGKPQFELDDWRSAQIERQQFKKLGKKDKPEGIDYGDYKYNIGGEFLKYNDNKLKKDTYEDVSKQSVKKIGEVDGNLCLGNCEEITEETKQQLEERYPDRQYKVRDVSQYKDSYMKHKVLEDDDGNIIDTQTWQYIEKEPTDLETRQTVFTPSEYREQGFYVDKDPTENNNEEEIIDYNEEKIEEKNEMEE